MTQVDQFFMSPPDQFLMSFDMASARSIIAFSFVASRSSIEATRPWCLKRRTSRIRRIDNLWVGIGLPHWLNEKPVARLSCRSKRPAPPKGAHDRLKSLLTML